VKFADMQGLSLYKIVRYHDIKYSELETTSVSFPIVRKDLEICTNITDFRIEYTAENRFDPRMSSGFKTPREDYESPAEPSVAPVQVPEATIVDAPAFRKTFGYGTMRIPNPFPRAMAFRAIFGDRQARQDHRPMQFGWDQQPQIRFAELTPGDKIFIFTESSRGGAGAGQIGVAGIASYLTQFPAGTYTVKNNVGGRLEFYEDVDTTSWQRDSPGIYYKAAFLPQALRITIRVIDDTSSAERQPKTLQRTVWVRQKAR